MDYHMDLLYDDVDHDDDDDKMDQNYSNRPDTVDSLYAMLCHSSNYAMLDFESFVRVVL